MENVIEDHEKVRKFVEQQTGGFVEKIEARSTSKYEATLDSFEDSEYLQRAGSTQVLIARLFSELRLKEHPTFIPTRYEVEYTVRVVFPPGEETRDVLVARIGGNELRIAQQRIEIRRRR